MKRTVSTIKQFDYTSKEEFEKDIIKMKTKGYKLFNCSPFIEYVLNEDIWKYTAYFIKSDMY